MKKKLPATPPTTFESAKVVILVIDEARSLLVEGKNSINHFRMLQRALSAAFTKDRGGIIGVLIDTNSKISDLAPPLSSDPSSRDDEGIKMASFPPFVLTHTMDVFCQKYCNKRAVWGDKMRGNDEMVVDMQHESVEAADAMVDDRKLDSEETKHGAVACGGKEEMVADKIAYKDIVTGSEQDAFNALIRMGRPLWYSTFAQNPDKKDYVINMAADKLLLGLTLDTDSYNEETMFGIASLLCRVGLRPYATVSFASRAIADFMAILGYVNYENEGYVCSYGSDPVLTLGAIKVWHYLNNGLATFMLPQLKRLFMTEALDTGGIGEVVARIVLLLAMDKCVMGMEPYVGQFITVHAFLKVLGVEELPIFTQRMREATDYTKDAFHTWLSKWDGWQMGFTHFVQLTLEPTEETLWYLLGRRAAGIFPRNQKGADLLIPIFWKKSSDEVMFESEMNTEDVKVSLILIQVKNRASHDSGFPSSATTKLCPSHVFGGKPKLAENPLSKQSVRDVICIYMNVQDENSKHRRFVYAKKLDDTKLSNTSAEFTKRKRMEALSSSMSGANVCEPKTHGSKSKVGHSKAKRAATVSGSSDSETTAGSQLMFTLCYRSVCCATYKFLDAEVAVRLSNLVETLWDPMVLVSGDLKHRQEKGAKDQDTACLSKAMGDQELKRIALKGFVNAPGRMKGHDDKMSKQQSSDYDDI